MSTFPCHTFRPHDNPAGPGVFYKRRSPWANEDGSRPKLGSLAGDCQTQGWQPCSQLPSLLSLRALQRNPDEEEALK